MEFEIICPCGVELRIEDSHVSTEELMSTFNEHRCDNERALLLSKHRMDLIHQRSNANYEGG